MSSLLVTFVWGGGNNFVGSGHKQSVKLLQSMVYNTTQQREEGEWGGGAEGVKEKVEGQQYTRV